MNNVQIIFLFLSIFKKIKLRVKMIDKMNEIQEEGENLRNLKYEFE